MHTAVHLVEDWKTDDGGQTWDSMGKDTISSSDVVSVSVSILEAGNGKKGFNTVYVGTEPTAFYRSDDGGESWDKMISLNNKLLFIMELSSKTVDFSCPLD